DATDTPGTRTAAFQPPRLKRPCQHSQRDRLACCRQAESKISVPTARKASGCRGLDKTSLAKDGAPSMRVPHISTARFLSLIWLPCMAPLHESGLAGPRVDRFGSPLPNGALNRLGTVRWRVPDGVLRVRFLEGGKHLMVCCADGIVRILDARDGTEVRRFG